ncbi:MAG TPA: phosphohistidine phosphatase SixA [Verrucomicrobiae bacterium]|jgi:phosphohistidine phosphatase|nr:phosphohistidine phosphatase SixA [Verrucomicrobiae bacterium]
MELYILRHGIAVERGDKRYLKDDSQRPLTREGREKMHLGALGLKAAGVEFDVLISSPYVRARETAEIVARVFSARKKLQFSEGLIAEAKPRAFLKEIQRLSDEYESVMIVGHEPFLGRLIGLLLTDQPNLPLVLKKGGLCHLNLSDKEYGIMTLLMPHHLRRMARKTKQKKV